MSSNTLPVCPKTGSTSPSLTVHLCLHTAPGNRECAQWELQQFADEMGLRVSVCHFPPGTSKWNKIEHRMFCHITENWRGRPLVSREVVVNLIGHTTTQSGLAIRSELDENSYPTGQPVTAEQMESLSLKRDSFTGTGTTVLRRERLRNNQVILASGLGGEEH